MYLQTLQNKDSTAFVTIQTNLKCEMEFRYSNILIEATNTIVSFNLPDH